MTGPSITDLLTEYKANPLGMDEPRPRFSYRLGRCDDLQKSRRVVVEDAAGDVVWDSGDVPSGESIQIEYDGPPLKPFARYFWRVEATTEGGLAAKSETAFFETGFLGGGWNASKWVHAPSGQGNYRPAARIAREFEVRPGLRSARLAATALGLYTPFVNGREITSDRFMPGWTQYETRVQYQVYDVTDFLEPGGNAVAALVGDGWYCGAISYVGVPPDECGWGRYPLFRAELRLEYGDGSVEVVGTDKSWRSFYLFPALLDNDIYLGEEYDAMFDDLAWKMPGGAKGAASGVREVERDTKIVWNAGAPVRVAREIRPVAITRRESGVYLLDFGENVAGVERVTVRGAHPNAVVTIRHAEALDERGNLWRDNLAFAKQTTTLTCGRDPGLVYSPRFTYYGFRYAEVSGWPEEMAPDSVVALVLSSAGERTGDFSCSNGLVDALYANVVRSQEGNFLDVPTDCPQRCERFGWTGDAQVFCETALTNFGTAAFFTKWIADLDAARAPSGAYPCLAPSPTLRFGPESSPGSAGWSDAGVVCPWMLYRKFGDRRILERNFDAMVRYVDLRDTTGAANTIGDHLALGPRPSGDFVSLALRIEMMRIAGKAAELLGRADVAARYAARRPILLREFHARFFAPDGELVERMQTAAAFVIVYGLAPSAGAREKARALLVRDIVENHGTHLATGFLGTPVLLRALTEAGEVDLAYRLLEQTTYPGWLYPVTQGATTIWERWNAIVDGKPCDEWMNSLNHYAYGSVAAWFYDTVCGIRDLSEESPEARGWKRFRLAPRPGRSLSRAQASVLTPYGAVSSAWRRDGGAVVWRFTVPCNTLAEVVLPGRALSAPPPGLAETAAGVLVARPGTYEVAVEPELTRRPGL